MSDKCPVCDEDLGTKSQEDAIKHIDDCRSGATRYSESTPDERSLN